MRAPLENRLWFAGEATSSATYGFVHSAWLEGESVAKSILQCIATQCPLYEKHEYITGCDVNVREKPRLFGQFSYQ